MKLPTIICDFKYNIQVSIFISIVTKNIFHILFGLFGLHHLLFCPFLQFKKD